MAHNPPTVRREPDRSEDVAAHTGESLRDRSSCSSWSAWSHDSGAELAHRARDAAHSPRGAPHVVGAARESVDTAPSAEHSSVFGVARGSPGVSPLSPVFPPSELPEGPHGARAAGASANPFRAQATSAPSVDQTALADAYVPAVRLRDSSASDISLPAMMSSTEELLSYNGSPARSRRPALAQSEVSLPAMMSSSSELGSDNESLAPRSSTRRSALAVDTLRAGAHSTHAAPLSPPQEASAALQSTVDSPAPAQPHSTQHLHTLDASPALLEASPIPDYGWLLDADDTTEHADPPDQSADLSVSLADRSQTALLPGARDSLVSLYQADDSGWGSGHVTPPRDERRDSVSSPYATTASPYTIATPRRAPRRPTFATPGDTWSEIGDEYYTPEGPRRRRPVEAGTPQYNVDLHRSVSRASSMIDMYAHMHDDQQPLPIVSPGSDKKYVDMYDAAGADELNSHVIVDDENLQVPDPHWPEPKSSPLSTRGVVNLGVIMLLVLALLMLFLGYPVLHFSRDSQSQLVKPHAGPDQSAIQQVRTSLIDPDTPPEAHTKTSVRDGRELQLVFSDEFETDGRSFYPGDDPIWEAVDLEYWVTENYEWYSPEAVTTADGKLLITLSETPVHTKNFRGALVSTWNKFCFTGGYIEARVQLPGRPNVTGLWPAVWTMGNLGRAGYGASTEGVWPYSYDVCDVGTLPNQTYPDYLGGGPADTLSSGHYIDDYGPSLSFLPGQRLSSCTCPESDDHPGPRMPDGSWKARAAPEIDVLEAMGNNGPGEHGQVSMSYQVAPFDMAYNYTTSDDAFMTHDPRAIQNSYNGSPYQQAVSSKVNTTDEAYELGDGNHGKYDTYGFEYRPGGQRDDAYITWAICDKPMATVNASALAPNPYTEVDERTITREPMYVIVNLGISPSFTWINWDEIEFPAHLRVDYVRVYQDKDNIQVGCSPPDYPTAAYIEKHAEVYNNPNLTTWLADKSEGGYAHPFPANKLLGQCR